jgi:hypothetical protein
VKLRTSTLDLLAREYAQAVADGDFERAEGWLATAALVANREVDRGMPPGRRRTPIRVRTRVPR